eukprot:Seg5013.1 transcript_id=Seg5013.1/GoldUCD/mRNA.D3Y31 product="hypothetical protein" protein_id=Seg5013.1/GoldUCD/D3Y31
MELSSENDDTYYGSGEEVEEESSLCSEEDQGSVQEEEEGALSNEEEDEEMQQQPQEESSLRSEEDKGSVQKEEGELSGEEEDEEMQQQQPQGKSSSNVEEDEEANKEPEKKADAKDRPLPEMTIYRLERKKMNSKVAKKFDPPTVNEKFAYEKYLCKGVVDLYNQQDRRAGNKDAHAARQEQHTGDDGLSISCSTNAKDDAIYEEDADYEWLFEKEISNSLVVGYEQTKHRENEVDKALPELIKGKKHIQTTINQILFVIVGQEVPSIYALTKKYAHFVVRNFCDTDFFFTIAKCSMDPKMNEVGKHFLVGKYRASSTLYRQASIPVYGGNELVNSLKSRFKYDSKIVIANQSLKITNKKAAGLKMTRSSVHIQKKQTLQQNVDNIEYMENLINSDRDDDENLAFLDYIKPVKNEELEERLENELIKMIWKDIANRRGEKEIKTEASTREGQEDSGFETGANCTNTAEQGFENPVTIDEENLIDFCYRDHEDYYRGTEFEVVTRKKDKIKWTEPESYEEVLNHLDVAFKGETTLEEFTPAIKKKRIRFKIECGEKPKVKDDLMNFFHAEIKVDGQPYFKIKAEWLTVDLRYIDQVHKDFQNLLKHKFRDQHSAVALPVSWTWNWHHKEKFRETDFRKVTKIDVKTSQDIWQCFDKEMKIVEKRQVKRSELKKHVLSESAVKHIKEPLSRAKKGKVNNEEVHLSQFTKIANDFLHQRGIVEGGKVKINKLEKFVEQMKHMNYFLSATDRMNEGEYNEVYSFLDSKENGLDPAEKENRWYVGDRILQDNIEVYDIMQVSEKGNDLYLYHVKEGFGQNTRDACSQIRVSASALRSAINSVSDDFLKNFYETIAGYQSSGEIPDDKNYRIEEKKKVENDQEKFLNIFKSRRITYVYAFLDTHQEERKLEEEIYRKVGKERSAFLSNIARLELMDLNKKLEELGFQLAIHQINREDKVGSKEFPEQVKQDEKDIEMVNSNASLFSSPSANTAEPDSPLKKKTKTDSRYYSLQ